MKERPIIFSGAMVRAILNGTKTQTRRVIQPQPSIEDDGLEHHHQLGQVCLSKFTGYPLVIKQHSRLGKITMPLDCPYGVTGDRLWVCETFTYITKAENEHFDTRRADGCPVEMLYRADGVEISAAWTPPIHMPRWASRITLEIVKVRVERLQGISEADALAEGIEFHGVLPSASDRFAVLWDDINAKRGFGWDVNPFVWVIEFRRVEP